MSKKYSPKKEWIQDWEIYLKKGISMIRLNYMRSRTWLKKPGIIPTILLVGVTGGLLLGGSILLWAATLRAPDIQSFETRKVQQSTKIYDRTGEVLLYDLRDQIKRTVVPFDQISKHLQQATIAIEDDQFYEHNGIRPLSFIRAIFANIFALEFAQGGSTITQQVVKNTILVQDKTIGRKLKEWVLAVKLEQKLSKDEILAVYLNETPYGGEIYGAEEASKTFFGVSANELTLSQAAYLAALPQAPTFYSPYGQHKDRLEFRKNLVLKEMMEQGYITKAEYEEAKVAQVEFQPPSTEGLRAAHFVFYVQEYLEEKFGADEVLRGGFKVTTTLDYKLQEKAEEIVQRRALENATTFNASNAALTAIDPKTGQILVMVGSRNYFDTEIDGAYNAAVAGNRQPGSAFKPFVYAEAFRKGYTPDTVVFDVRTQFSTACPADNETSDGECYSPGNYDNLFRGPMTLRDALAQSVNVPAVKTLYLAGLRDSLRLAQGMGISTLGDPSRYGLTLVLGGGEVSLIDMTSAYGVFANEGTRNPPNAILKIEDMSGNVLEEFNPKPVKVLEENVARTISDVLSDNEARAPAFGERSYLYFGNNDVAVKTGTTNEYRDAWIVGYTPEIAIGAWAGNNDNTPMEKKVAGFIIAPLWNEVMQQALAEYGQEYFNLPGIPDPKTLKPALRGDWQGSQVYTIDKVSGKLATEYTPEDAREDRVVKELHSILHWVNRSDPNGPVPINPNQDGQYHLWEYGVQKWKLQNNFQDEDPNTIIPKEFDNIHTAQNTPTIEVSSPRDGNSYERSDSIPVVFTWRGQNQLAKTEYLLNGRIIATQNGSSPSFTLNLSIDGVVEGENTLSVVARDSNLYKATKDITFTVEE